MFNKKNDKDPARCSKSPNKIERHEWAGMGLSDSSPIEMNVCTYCGTIRHARRAVGYGRSRRHWRYLIPAFEVDEY